MPIDVPDLIRTDVALAAFLGVVETHDTHVVVRTPHNPEFYHGNFLLLPGPPEDLAAWCARFEEAFGPDTRHRCFAWGGAPLSEAGHAEARRQGFSPDDGVALALDAAPEMRSLPSTAFRIRPLVVPDEQPAYETLNRACDPSEGSGSESYRRFKERIRETHRRWMAAGQVDWWGVYREKHLVAQCGLAILGDLGRFQAVETHPDHRRQGLCSALIAHVARHAFEARGCRRVLLHADGVGPAVGLYRRLGFREDGACRSLVREGEDAHLQAETPAHDADVRSLLRHVLGDGAALDAALAARASPGAWTRMAVRSGALVGYVVAVPRASGTDAPTIQSLVVRPDRRDEGIEAMLRAAVTARA